MADDHEELKSEGEVENPKSVETITPATAPAASLPPFSFNIWPPSQRTRDAVINRLVENLSTPSILSKRYGTLPSEEATAVARLIEQEAFAFASASASASSLPTAKGDDVGSAEASVDEGIEILQIYSKEISRRMIETVKTKGSSVSPAPTEGNVVPVPGDGGDVTVPVPNAADLSAEETPSGESAPLAASE